MWQWARWLVLFPLKHLRFKAIVTSLTLRKINKKQQYQQQQQQQQQKTE